MPTHHLGPGDGLRFEHRSPAAASGLTFVFFNAPTGDAASWEVEVAPALRARGQGTLVWNFRGQKDSPVGAFEAVSARQIVADAVTLMAARTPPTPGSMSGSRSAGCSPRRPISPAPGARGSC